MVARRVAHRSGPSSARGRRASAVAFGGVVFVLALLASSVAAAASPWMGSGDFLRAAYAHGSGTTAYCGKGIARPSMLTRTGFFCGRSKVAGSGGTPGIAEVEIGFSVREHIRGLSGNLSAFETGSLALAAGFARAHLTCSAGAVGRANATLQWQLAIEDYQTGQSALDRVGNLWTSGNLSCPAGHGSVSAVSPAFSGAFNSSAYTSSAPVTGSFNASHPYLVFLRFFCSADAQVSSGSATAFAACNFQATASSNTFTIDGATFD